MERATAVIVGGNEVDECKMEASSSDKAEFNSQQPHCRSSRTNKDDVIYSLSFYIKSKDGSTETAEMEGLSIYIKSKVNKTN